MKVSTNLVNLENISSSHINTAPETYDFFTMQENWHFLDLVLESNTKLAMSF